VADGEWITEKPVIAKLALERGGVASSAYCGRCRAEAGVYGDLVHPPECRATLKDIKFRVIDRPDQSDDC